MSVEVVKSQVAKFLASNNSEVLAIKGPWGIGKTYTWNRYLLEARNNKSLAYDKYSYVTLFGLNSLETLKYAIFEQVIKKDVIGTNVSIETFKENTSSLADALGRKSLSFISGVISGIPYAKGFASGVESLAFLSLTETLVCIDDLERKGSNLSIKDVLGLVSLLKEQKKCKIVILLNDGEEGLEDYKKYREKVIDQELTFSPTALECANIAFEGESYSSKKLKELTPKLDIKNIRILKKIERLVDLALPLLKDFEEEISHQAIHSIVLFAWCIYSNNPENPPIDFVTKLDYSFFGLGDEDEDNLQIKKWKGMLKDYGYELVDELDLELSNCVERGFFIEEKLQAKAKVKNDQIVAAKSDESFTSAWRIYHDSFENNQDEVIGKLYDSFKINYKYIALNNLNGTVKLFRELGEGKKADELIDFYIQNRLEETEIFNLERNNHFGDTQDPIIIYKFSHVYEASVSQESADQVLERLSNQNGWNQSDEIILSNTSVDEYYKLFKSQNGPQLRAYVRVCLKFRDFTNASAQHKQIVDRATNALKRIAAESEINKRRVKQYGIDVEPGPASQ